MAGEGRAYEPQGQQQPLHYANRPAVRLIHYHKIHPESLCETIRQPKAIAQRRCPLWVMSRHRVTSFPSKTFISAVLHVR